MSDNTHNEGRKEEYKPNHFPAVGQMAEEAAAQFICPGLPCLWDLGLIRGEVLVEVRRVVHNSVYLTGNSSMNF